MKTYLLFVFLIGNALAFTTSRSSYTGPMDMLMKKVGFGLYKLDRKICDAQDQIEEIKEVLTAHEEQLTALETGQEQQNGRLDTLEEGQVMQDGLIASLQTGQDFQAGEIVALQEGQGIQDGLINNLQIEQGIQGGEIVELGEVNDEQDVSLTDLEEGQVMQDGLIASLQEGQGIQAGQIVDLQGKDEEQDERLIILEESDVEQLGRIDMLEEMQDELYVITDEHSNEITVLQVENCLLEVQLEMVTSIVVDSGPFLSCPEFGMDCTGDDLPDQPITELGDWEACAEECRITSGCKYWTYVPVDDNCWLKSACNGLTGAADMFSGHRSCKQCFEECDASNHYLLDAYSRRVANDVREFEDVEDSSNDVPTSPDWVDNGPHWYKFDDNSRMHETNTDYPACGGYYVIRLSGTHPTEIGQYSAIFKDDGGNPYEGKMTNCGEFFVYLLPDTMNESRYCSDFV